ncbi:hypothetical protein IMCC14465_10090 [alpha proteobacterium IMCC14465]|uniref:Uncharacterized protein n=1 Tax=alpha proteobacterium IMCC14465 TaxID=1220535 RepID=J9DGG8_9PROT|nr:hypothetical protein IMCC14465_10090 [alpha proteobacterium IMCC14465]
MAMVKTCIGANISKGAKVIQSIINKTLCYLKLTLKFKE